MIPLFCLSGDFHLMPSLQGCRRVRFSKKALEVMIQFQYHLYFQTSCGFLHPANKR